MSNTKLVFYASILKTLTGPKLYIRNNCNEWEQEKDTHISHKGSLDERADPICGPPPVLPVCEGGSLEALDESTQL